MHPSERIRKTLNHEQPDRVPMMFSGSRRVIERLKEHLGGIGSGAETDRQLMRALGMDIWDTRGFDYKTGVGAKYIGPKLPYINDDWPEEHFFSLYDYHEHITENEYGLAYSMGKPCVGEEAFPAVESLERFPWPQPDWFDYSTIRQQIEPWAEEFAVIATGPSVFTHPSLFRGIEQLMYEMEANPDVASFVITKVADFYYGYFEQVFEQAGDLVQIVRLADDIGAQTNLFISPENLEDFLAPHVRRFAEMAHRYDVKLMFHTDGNVWKAIPALIEWGVDQLDPIQPEVPEMEAADLKREFGDRLCFSGGIGAQEILPRGSVEEVKAEVKRVLDIMMPGGGYILSPGHPSLQMDVPPQNIAAMFEAGREYGQYGAAAIN